MKYADLRALLLMAYMAVGFLACVFFAGPGEGSYAPPAILYGWGIVPWQLGLVPGELGLWLVPNGYLVGLFLAATVSVQSKHPTLRFAPLALHLLGVVVAAVQVKHGHLATGWWLVASYLIPALIAVGYLACDWALAVSARRPASADA